MPNDTHRESSPSTGWKETVATMEAEAGLGEYIDEFRDDLEVIAEAAYPVSPVIQALLDRRDRGEIEC